MAAYLLSGDVSNFKKLSNFNSKEEMDLAIRSFLYLNKHRLTQAEKDLVKRCSQLACKLKGVFYPKHDYLAKLLHISSKTVQRGLLKLAELGLLTIKETRKTSGGKGHNVYVINEIETVDFDNLENSKKGSGNSSVQSNVQSGMSSRESSQSPCATTDQGVKKHADTKISDTKSSKRIKHKTIEHSSDPHNDIDEIDLVGHWVPERFKNLASLAFQSAKEIESVFKYIRKPILAYKYGKKVIEELSCKVMLGYIRKVKKNEKVNNPFGYISAITDTILTDYYMQDCFEASQDYLESKKISGETENSTVPFYDPYNPNELPNKSLESFNSLTLFEEFLDGNA